MDLDRIKMLREKANALPKQPGVYYMKNREGKIIYVGKAKILPNRVSSYFKAIDNHLPKVYKMVSNVYDFDYIITSSEMEALILECAEIKRYKPKYNILLKDDKAYPYIKITNGDYPRIEITRKREDDGGKYFGPFTGNISLAVDTARKVFGIPSCSRKFPAEIGKMRHCIEYDIGNCIGVCTGNVTQDEYKERIASVEKFFKGAESEIVAFLQNEMEIAANKLEYEKAAQIRDKIMSVKKLSESQMVVGSPSEERDVIGVKVGIAKAVVSFIAIRGGKITAKRVFSFSAEDFSDRQTGLESFIYQYYDSFQIIPPEVLLPYDCPENDMIASYLSKRRGKKVRVIVPQRGSLKQLCDIAQRNAEDALSHLELEEEKAVVALKEMKEVLLLENIPKRIEIIDISHTAGTENVGAIVTYVDGKKSSKDYKKFKIKSFEGADDCGSMREVLTRRFENYLAKKSGFEILPDMMFVDGGEAQLNTALSVVNELGVPVRVFGLVKNEFHKTRAIISENGVAEVKMTSPAFRLAAEMQEEVHRYVIGFHRQRRSNALTRSKLDLVPGIGKAKKTALIKAFGSVSNIEKADVTDIAALKGFSLKQAQEILDCLKNI